MVGTTSPIIRRSTGCTHFVGVPHPRTQFWRLENWMFNLLVTSDETAWETDQFMRILADRFREYSGSEAVGLTVNDVDSLRALERVDSILLYESGGTNESVVRFGHLY